MEQPWSYHPQFISNSKVFTSLYQKLVNKCRATSFKIFDKLISRPRISCAFADLTKNNNLYSGTPVYDWNSAPPELKSIKDKIETTFHHKIDYVLVHIYRDHNDHIGWHFDSEATQSEIFSLSLGETRRFILKNKKNPKSSKYEYYMENGDLIHMYGPRKNHPGCQNSHVHSVPKMTFKEIKSFLQSRKVDISSLKKKNDFIAYMQKEKLYPVRMNLTFRQHQD